METKVVLSVDRSSAPCPAPTDPKFDHDHGQPDSALSPDKGKIVPTHSVSQANDAPPTNAGGEAEDEQKSNKLDLNFDFELFSTVNSHIREERFDELLNLINIDRRNHKNMNMVDDPVLIIAICAKKTQLAIGLIDNVGTDTLKQTNIFCDTALHIAAAEGNTDVAEALLRKEPDLIKLLNKKGETALHKAAMYGHERTFWCLVNADKTRSMIYSRKRDGSTVLHSAIMAYQPKLALDIATKAEQLEHSRNEAGLTPLQLAVTLPNFFRSPLVLGSFLYKLIPFEEDSQSKDTIIADEEAGESMDTEEPYGGARKSMRSKFLPGYTVLVIARSFQRVVFNILKPFIPFLQTLRTEKKRYVTAMKLVQRLLVQTGESGYDFYCKGLGNTTMRTAFELIESQAHQETEKPTLAGIQSPPKVGEQDSQFLIGCPSPEKTGMPISNRWLEPPLIIAAELGLHDLVRKILHLCPESVIYLDSKDRNFVQVAIKSGHKEVVSVISEIFQGKQNPPLHSFLCSVIDVESKNTFLHLAAENDPVEEGDALQLHHQLAWFEMVEKIVPNELRYSRNKEEKTAHELFTKNHKKSLEDCKKQLVELGKVCAGLVATVVLTSSFSIPNERDNESGNFAFKIVSHAYMIGFGCAATALVLFLSLILRSYKERDFRRAIPMQFFIACLSFALALGAFYLTVVCNIILQIYGSKMNMKHLIPLILELALYPVVCFTVLLYPGVGPTFFRIWK